MWHGSGIAIWVWSFIVYLKSCIPRSLALALMEWMNYWFCRHNSGITRHDSGMNIDPLFFFLFLFLSFFSFFSSSSLNQEQQVNESLNLLQSWTDDDIRAQDVYSCGILLISNVVDSRKCNGECHPVLSCTLLPNPSNPSLWWKPFPHSQFPR